VGTGGSGVGVGVGRPGVGTLAFGALPGDGEGATATTGTAGGGGNVWAVGATVGRATGDATAPDAPARGDATGLTEGRAATAAGFGLEPALGLATTTGASDGSGVGSGVAFTRSITARATDGPAVTPVTAVATATVAPISPIPIGPLRKPTIINALITTRSFLLRSSTHPGLPNSRPDSIRALQIQDGGRPY
jgi:hypothetical protein